MQRLFVLMFLCFFSLRSIAAGAPVPVTPMQTAVSGVMQQKMQSRGFAANDPRFDLTLKNAGSAIAGAAAAGVLITAAGVTAPAWVTAAAATALGIGLTYLFDFAIDGVKWMINADGTITTVGGVTTVTDSSAPWTLTAGGSCINVNNLNNNCVRVGEKVSSFSACLGPPYQNPTNSCLSGWSSSGYPRQASSLQDAMTMGGYSQPTTTVGADVTNGNLQTAVSNISAADLAKELNPLVVAALADAAWKKSAAEPGYAGVPYDAANPITPVDAVAFQQANPSHWPTVGDAVAPQAGAVGVGGGAAPSGGTSTSPFYLPSGAPSSVINPETQSPVQINPGTGEQVNLGSDPGIGSPTLEATPSAQSILDPLLNSIPGVRSFVVPAHSSTCPTWTFSMWDHQFAMDGQCQLAEQLRTPISATMLLFFALAALLIVLAA
ncbi:hypothetical protein [Janthinobacterium sp. HLX7-2]|uniref:hypothetical protein n=1 Tax=Janthinobacterium sp. HLX7-2 TaxID=1259331 RepID=UPI003F29BA34